MENISSHLTILYHIVSLFQLQNCNIICTFFVIPITKVLLYNNFSIEGLIIIQTFYIDPKKAVNI